MMFDEIHTYCLAKPGAYLSWPFGPDNPVVKVKAPSQENGRIFAGAFLLRAEPKLTLRCEMMAGEFYRGAYPGSVTRGYHCPPVQQPYFNTVSLDGAVPDDVIYTMIDQSYAYALKKMPKKYQTELTEASGHS